MRLGAGCQDFQPAPVGYRVVVKRRHVSRIGPANSLVYRTRKAGVALVYYHARAAAKTTSTAGAAIIDHHHLKKIQSLQFQRVKAFLQSIADSQSRNDNSDQWSRQDTILTRQSPRK